MLIYIEERLIKCYSIHGSSKRLCGLFLVSELTILLLRSQNYCLFLQSKSCETTSEGYRAAILFNPNLSIKPKIKTEFAAQVYRQTTVYKTGGRYCKR